MHQKIAGSPTEPIEVTGFDCPHCGEYIDLYPPGGAKKASIDFNIPLLGNIPFEVEISQQGDIGIPFVLKYPDNKATKAFKEIVKKITDMLEK